MGAVGMVLLFSGIAPVGYAQEATKGSSGAEISDEMKLSNSQQYIGRMRKILTQVLKHLEEARHDRDIIKLNCVNDKLTAVKGLLKISEQANINLQEAIVRRDIEVAAYEYDKITIALSKIELQLAESEACVGEAAVYSGDTQIELVYDNEDKSQDDIDAAHDVDLRPPAASPFQ